MTISRSLMSRSRNLPRSSREPEIERSLARESKIDDEIWRDFERSCLKAYGRDTGSWVFAGIARGEHDFGYASRVLVGVNPLEWQVRAWDLLDEYRYEIVQGSNTVGKTTDYALVQMLAGFYRRWATPAWGASQYRILALAPQAPQSLESKMKIDGWLKSRGREQQFRIPGGYDHRPCLLTPFFESVKHDDGQHQGFDINGGTSIITYRSTAYKAKGSDGTDPALVTWDELRHETNFSHVWNVILQPRFIRVPFARALLYYTPLEASVELVVLSERGRSTLPDDIDFCTLDLDVERDNKTVGQEEIDRANRNIEKRYRPMVTGGKPIQPAKAKFNQASVVRSFIGTIEPEWLSDLFGVRRRVMARCAKCQGGLPHTIGEPDSRKKHPMVGFLDPASSARYDLTVGAVWDLEPQSFPEVWAEQVYLEELPPGTIIQRVGIHVAVMSLIIHGPVGYDANSALGHGVKDNVQFLSKEEILDDDPKGFTRRFLRSEDGSDEFWDKLVAMKDELADDCEIVPCDHNSKREKDEDLDFFSNLMDLDKYRAHFHLVARAQTTNYERDDKSIAQDYVMVQVGAAWVAKWYMPDLESEKQKRGRVKQTQSSLRDDEYAGAGFTSDPYFGMPDGSVLDITMGVEN